MTPTSRRSPAAVLPSELLEERGVSFLAYQRAVQATDKLPDGDITTSILGLFGEVGSLVAVIKKSKRDADAYVGYDAAAIEEFGDVLWYLTSIANRAGLDLSVLAQRVSREIPDWDETQRDEFGTWSDIQSATPCDATAALSGRAVELAASTGELLAALGAGRLDHNRDLLAGHLVLFLRHVISTADAAEVDLDEAARLNLKKVFSRYPLDRTYPPAMDLEMPIAERLPTQLEVFIVEHMVGGKLCVRLTCNGVALGDQLTDNKVVADDYRFHDIFHLAYAVHLGWSPTLRALLRAKRKSVPRLDENEDGARAILTEEGVATFVFGRALERHLFEGLAQLDLDLLKLVHGMVIGFEADRCALWQWERAILDGFKVFRELKKHRKGRILADLDSHSLTFSPAPSEGIQSS